MAFVVLNYFSHLVTSAIEAVVEQVLTVFMISSLIGSHLVYYANAIARFLLFAFDSLYTAIKIVCKDFMTFLNDVEAILSIVCDILLRMITFILEGSIGILAGIKGAVLYLVRLPFLFCLAVSSAFEDFLLCFVKTANLLKSAITLLGTSIWMAIMFIPNSLIFLCHLIVLSCTNIACTLYESFVSVIADTGSGLYDIAVKLFQFFVDIPCEACGGLAIGVFLIWLTLKHKNIFKTFFVRAYLLHLKAVMILVQLVRQPCQFVIHQLDIYRRHVFWRRRRNAEGGVVNDIFAVGGNSIASSSDEGESPNSMLNLKKKLEAALEEKMCSVCQERRKTVIVLPCRHLCMCEDCVLIVERVSRRCPLCRRPIVKTMSVYL